MLNLKYALAQDIRDGIAAAQEAGTLPKTKQNVDVTVAHSDSSEHGDYASPVALALTKLMKKPPLEIVEAIAGAMPKKEYVGKLEAAAPGFLNIRLNPGWMTARLDDVVEEGVISDTNVGAGRSVNMEFISANPTGPMTLGNARSAFSADTLGNILTEAGFNVMREYYINDAGAQVRKLGESVLRRMVEAQGKKVEFPEELYQGEYIKEVAKAIAEKWRENEGKQVTEADLENKETLERLSQEAVGLLLAHIKRSIVEDLHIQFDVWTSEAALRASGVIEKAIEVLRERGEVYEKDGATWLATTKYGDDADRVVIKKDGEYAYFAPDIAYHHNKYERGFDFIFTFLGADHSGHIPRLKAAMQALGHDVAKLHFPVHQWLRLIRGGAPVGLSKRRGEVYTPHDLIGEVGYDAARFLMVQQRLETHLDFDLDLAVERSDRNPVYYVQYAYVRLQSILRRAKEEGQITAIGVNMDLVSNAALTQTAEIDLMRALYRWPEVLDDSAKHFAAHTLAYYASDLAKAVHVFYKNVPVLRTEDEVVLKSRLQLVVTAQKVLEKTLDILGISKPDVM